MSQPTGTVVHKHADADGHFRRKASSFRDTISKDPKSKYPAESGRYALYMNYGCPWAHRTSIVRALKGLEDHIQMIATDFDLTSEGWTFTGELLSIHLMILWGRERNSMLMYFIRQPRLRYQRSSVRLHKNQRIVPQGKSRIHGKIHRTMSIRQKDTNNRQQRIERNHPNAIYRIRRFASTRAQRRDQKGRRTLPRAFAKRHRRDE